MKRASIVILILGLVVLGGVFMIRQQMESLRTDITTLSDLIAETSGSSEQQLIDDRIVLMDQIADFDLYSKVLLVSGAVLLLAGITMLIMGRKKTSNKTT
ncbi:hypothetical protein [Parvicella tangerina]|uniref:Uncharacterized protein n=1 Tax=Parvicella tangerina TaxID=2829795 RepID=A0A916JQP3_9FLAO|nr:hypothetical protein [Parvicella tangerina]CAG5087664.1 hypothetical protein CRYO30217_03541 [Parvicella tangerina]